MNCPSDRAAVLVLVPALLVAPLLIALLWGVPPGDGAYVGFARARSLAAGRELATGSTTAETTSPLYLVLWMALDRLGIPLLPASVVLSGLGWSATALALYGIGRSIGRPLAAVTSAILIVINPLVASTLGTEVSWVIALFWIAVWLAIRGDWQVQGSVLAWMLWVRLDWMMLAWALAMLGLQWRERRRFPLRSVLVLAIAVSAYVLVAVHTPSVWVLPRLDLAGLSYLGQLLAESDWYWLGLPLAVLGLLAVRHRTLWMGLLGCLLASTGHGIIAGSCLLAAGALLAGLGADWCAHWIETRTPVRPVRLNPRAIPVPVCLALIALLPLGIAQVSSLSIRCQDCPIGPYDVERQAGDWLASQGEPGETLFGSARLAYLSSRQAVLWDGRAGSALDMAAVIGALSANQPTYCGSRNTIAWQWLVQSEWFLDRYEPLKRFEAAHNAVSPLTIWRYRLGEYDRGTFHTKSVSLPGGVQLVGVQYWPERIEPGEVVYAALSFQSTRPVTSPLQTIVRVYSPNDGLGWAQQNSTAPHSVPVDWWQAGQTVTERYVLTTSLETPVGAYQLDLLIPGSDIDGLALGYVAVPWRGELDGVNPVEARFSDQIQLLGYKAPDSVAAGDPVDVTLYWEALRPPGDSHIAFIHLVDPDGQRIAGHDGVPMNGRYPTQAWIPDEIVEDVHRVSTEAGTPSGTYLLKVGMYAWPGLERLPVWDRAGTEQADRTLVLQRIELR